MSARLARPGPGEVVVVLAERVLLASGGSCLSPGERRRAAGIVHPAARARFEAGRVLLRRTLAALSGLGPAAVAVEGLEWQAPVAGPPLEDLGISLSHGETVEGVAVAGGAVGIDIEERSPPDFDAVAAVVMTPDELEAFVSLPAGARRVAFLRVWTRKEAVLKAAGLGFSRDPRSFAVGAGPSAGQVRLDAGGPAFAVADLPDGLGAVALAGPSIALRVESP